MGRAAPGSPSSVDRMDLRARWQRAARDLRRVRTDAPEFFPTGAFYSPVVNATEVLAEPDRSRIWPADPVDPPGVDLRGDAQLALLRELSAYPLPAFEGPPPAYDPTNDQFPVQDASLLYALLRHLRPARLVEVGCGWSTTVASRAIADGGLGTRHTCIEPYPRDFLRSMPSIDALVEQKVEHVPLGLFDELGPGDVLFIDTSHVAKTGSDVVHLVLQVLPRLRDGVVVHVHDIFIPEDYPLAWVAQGFGWNEQYLLQAFLVGNARAHVLAMNHWLSVRHPEAVTAAFGEAPFHGSSAWFRIGPAPAQRGDAMLVP